MTVLFYWAVLVASAAWLVTAVFRVFAGFIDRDISDIVLSLCALVGALTLIYTAIDKIPYVSSIFH